MIFEVYFDTLTMKQNEDINTAIAQARADARAAALEEAAKWHNDMAAAHERKREITNVVAEDGRIDRAGEEWARRHHSYAAAIRALIEESP